MLNAYLKKIQMKFLVVVVLLFTTVSVGSFALQGSDLLNSNYWDIQKLNLQAMMYNWTSTVNATITVQNGEGARSVPVLLYHSIVEENGPKADSPDGVSVTLKNFKEQMQLLKERGWQAVSLEEFNDYMDGKTPLPEKSFLLTFDDGAKASFYPVDPILKSLDYRAVSFVISKFSIGGGSNYYLSSRELDFMNNSGRWEIQSHGKEDHTFYTIDAKGTQGHFLSNKLWREGDNRLETDEEYSARIGADFAASKNDIQGDLGNNVIGFAYPFGDYGQQESNSSRSQDIVLEQAKAVYQKSFYQIWGNEFSQNIPSNDSFLVGRIEVNPQWSGEDLLRIMDNGLIKSVAYHDTFISDAGWSTGWGESHVNDRLELRADANGTGAMTILDGTQLWSNYTAQVQVEKTGDFSIVGRFQDIKNYVSCDFTDRGVRLVEVVDGKTIVRSTTTATSDDAVQVYSMSLQGEAASCSINGDDFASTSFLSDKSLRGGFGFKIYNPTVSAAQANVTDLLVNEI